MCTPILPRFLFIVALAAVILGSFCSYAQDDGIITFYGDKNFKGEKFQYHLTLEPQYCYNDNVGKPSSITWRNQIKTGHFDGKAKIAFFTKHDCKGKTLAWFTTEDNFPRNLALDQIDNQIKSFMLLQKNWLPDVIVRNVY
ncbi:hypothetical protein PF005_g8372 [Phytophthora fragariae]|uniref:Uncharacterized protein n=1 Tax=Phytophthora fragariae TaxID=53985 RepID=A0A6A3L2S5_9STRA|nr:hypothetical protein PF003_g21264 [Phytophthora fragariae]KAE8941576.1 hypothetical protein PF009_g8645 [Phytophthora fragariae]KAE9013210.1 hypothetical protein PF011_g8578 [Phytophthora fragariae]KAE9120666.1 hypothetical protein PF007_g8077 [Phytophthora fragariae]KAE9125407.1 hypothetical protein PF010_g5641 [Phytophthora fragariae]